MHITIVIEPIPPLPDLPKTESTTREFFKIDDLARELRSCSEAEVDIQEVALESLDTDGFVLLVPGSGPRSSLASLPAETRRILGPRVFLLRSDQATNFDVLNELSLAGAVEYVTYYAWKTGSRPAGHGGIYGRTKTAETLGAMVLFAEGDYCVLREEPDEGFVPLLVHYLSALEAGSNAE